MLERFFNTTKKKTSVYYILIAIWIFIPIVLILLPNNFFDDGPPICLFTRLSGINCYGCGITRAVMHLIHFDFENAFAYNMLSFIVLPLLFILWIQNIKALYKKLKA